MSGITGHPTSVIAAGIDALFKSMIVSAWTTFETLAGDVWEAALNEMPHPLALLKGGMKRIERLAGTALAGAEETASEQGSGGRSIRLNEIARATRGNFDLRQKMGTILHGDQKFTTLTGIRRAYSTAFEKRSTAIDAVLARKDLDALTVVRNAIVHRAGSADAEYVERSRGLALAPQVPVGHQLPLDGEFTANLLNSAVHAGNELVVAVDEWVGSERGAPKS